MKNLLIIPILLLSLTTLAQQSIHIVEDDMSSEVTYKTKYSFEAVAYDKVHGLILRPYIDLVDGKPSLDLYSTVYFAMTYKIKDAPCTEDLRITFKFSDNSLLETKFATDFNCDGTVVYGFTKQEVARLANNKIVKVQITDGESYKYQTAIIKEDKFSNYFRDLFIILNN